MAAAPTDLHLQGMPELWAPYAENEGYDRTDLRLPGQQLELAKNLARRTDTPLVVVLVHGGPVDVAWLQESPRIGAILTAWYPGQVRATLWECVGGCELLGDFVGAGTGPWSGSAKHAGGQAGRTWCQGAGAGRTAAEAPDEPLGLGLAD